MRKTRHQINPGDKFGKLTIIKNLLTISKSRRFLCKCDCGNVIEKYLKHILRSKINDCGCNKSKFNIEIGKKYGKLLILEEVESPFNKKWGKTVKCQCDCGNQKVIPFYHMLIGSIKTCGCGSKSHGITHGKSKIAEYTSWLGMKKRCYNEKNISYKNYGARGVTVCDRWLNSFEAFFEDMGPKPSKDHSLDRIDNNKLIDGYSKENCRWATWSEQMLNRRPRKSSSNTKRL